MDINLPNTSKLTNLTKFNLVVGRNGSGKSRLLRNLNTQLRMSTEHTSVYISPERTGIFQQDANVETNIARNINYEFGLRNKNQAQSFKETSFVKLKKLKENFADKIQTDLELRADFNRTFDTDYLNDLNSLNHNVQISYANGELVISTIDEVVIKPDDLSSGESEAITLAVEIMSQLEKLDNTKTNIFIVDEPEAHLHPDLQVRMVHFIVKRLSLMKPEVQDCTHFILSTHSTSLLGAFMELDGASIGVKKFGVDDIVFSRSADVLKDTVPFFAHPLSSVFNLETPLIVEGSDDERIWQQVARSKQGAFRYFPCLATSVDIQDNLEKFLHETLPAFYDTPRAVSVRDGDNKDTNITHMDFLKRYRLHCYEAENLLLTNEVLAKLGTTWEGFQEKALKWCEGEGAKHPDKKKISALVSDEGRQRNAKIKSIRNLILGINECSKPWEVIVGQSIANVDASSSDPHSIYSYLGAELCIELGLVTDNS